MTETPMHEDRPVVLGTPDAPMGEVLSPPQAQASDPLLLQQGAELRKIRRSLGVIMLLALLTGAYFARELLLPIVLAIILTLTLRPLVGIMARIGLPPPVTAFLIVIGIAVAVVAGGFGLSGPVGKIVAEVPEIGQELRFKLRGLFERMENVQEMQDEMSGMAETSPQDAPTEVVLDQRGLIPQAVGSVASATTSILGALVLTLFLLASGDFYHRRIIEASPRLTDKKRSLMIVRDVERQVSRYLAAITVINAALGVCVGVALWLLGMPMAVLWGVVAFLLNFLPFVGALIGVAAVAAVSIVTFDTLGQALLAPLSYLALTTIEGNFVTPSLVGRRLELNTVAVLVTVVFWIWLWGVPGAILAVPILVVVKVVCDNVPAWHTFGSFLSGDVAKETPPHT